MAGNAQLDRVRSRFGAQVENVVVEAPKNDDEAYYLEVFDAVQQFVVTEKLSELSESLEKGDNSKITDITKTYLTKHFPKIAWEEEKLIRYTKRCVADMTGYSFLTKYFARSAEIEEININAWDTVEVRWCDGRDEITGDRFHSPEHGKDVMTRILKATGKYLDDNRVYDISYVGKAIRIAVAVSPLVDAEIGVVASIRFIHSAVFTLDNMIDRGFLLSEMGRLLSSFITHGVSVIVCGATGSGKTTMLNALLENVPAQKRVVTLEDGTREFELIRKDENGKVINNRVHMQTRPHKDSNLNVDLQALLDLNLKFDPDIVVVGEMVSEEAFIASEMARTGHTVLTTIHTNDAFDAYYRMFTLGIRKYALAENLMLKFMVDAFPIVVYCKKYPDGTRRVQSILEGHYENGEIQYNELYHFDVKDNIIDENGTLHTVGEFRHLNYVNEKLLNRMLDNGATRSMIEQLNGVPTKR